MYLATDAVSPARPTESHVRALDGIRGLAILLVLAVHTVIASGIPADSLSMRLLTLVASAGWCGVDLFFVLSGYLITGILWDAKDSRHYFRNFYARRTVRIFPLYYGFLLVYLVLRPLMTGHPAGVTACWFWLYLANYSIAFRPEAVEASLTVLWSLAIEEQFYLVWPAVVRVLSRRVLLFVCAALVPGALLARILLILFVHRAYPPYMLTFARLDTLAIGAFIALATRSGGGVRALTPIARPVALASAGCVMVLFVWRHGLGHTDPVVQTIGFTALALLFGSLLVLVLGSDGPSPYRRVFENPALCMFGLYSYAIYLLHLPVIVRLQWVFARAGLDKGLAGSALAAQLLFSLLAVGTSLLVALGSWHAYEKHWLKLKRFFPRRA